MLFLYIKKIHFGNACHLINNRLKIRTPLDLMKANKSLIILLPSSCNPHGIAVFRRSGPFCLEHLKALLDSGGSQEENASMENWYIPLCGIQGSSRERLLVILTVINMLWTIKTYFPFWISIKKTLATGKSTCYSLAHYIQLHADTYSAVYFFSMNKETNRERERNSCLVLQWSSNNLKHSILRIVIFKLF